MMDVEWLADEKIIRKRNSKRLEQLSLNLLQLIVDENEDLGEFFTENVKEVIALLKNYKEITSEKISNAKFANAWGRGMQYMCFKKLDKRMKKEQ